MLNRTVIYRGLLEDSWIYFVTERNSRKYQNLKENPKCGLTMLFHPDANKESQGDDLPQTWQVRLLGAEAVEAVGETLAEGTIISENSQSYL